MNRPAFQFYPADWRKDLGLQTCSMAAKGMWIDLLCIMHESENYGFLEISGAKTNQKLNDFESKTNQKLNDFESKTNQKRIKIDSKLIGKLVGLSENKATKLIAELEENRVFSRDEDGIIYCRRMVKDERIRSIRAEAGKLGGNPLLVKQKQPGLVKQTDAVCLTSPAKFVPPPSSSSSSSSSSSEKEKEKSARTLKLPPAQEPETDDWSGRMPTASANDFQKLESWINSLHPSWKARPHFSRIEREELLGNSRIFFDLTDKDKTLLAAYLDAAIPEEWGKFWQPDQRGQLVRSVMDVLAHADRWERECRKRKIGIQFKLNA